VGRCIDTCLTWVPYVINKKGENCRSLPDTVREYCPGGAFKTAKFIFLGPLTAGLLIKNVAYFLDNVAAEQDCSFSGFTADRWTSLSPLMLHWISSGQPCRINGVQKNPIGCFQLLVNTSCSRSQLSTRKILQRIGRSRSGFRVRDTQQQ